MVRSGESGQEMTLTDADYYNIKIPTLDQIPAKDRLSFDNFLINGWHDSGNVMETAEQQRQHSLKSKQKFRSKN